MGDWDEPPSAAGRKAPPKPQAELSYVSSLNFVLPSTIRVIAWSPVSPDFSARFNCRYRHYKYFFSPRGLDVDAMRDAAERLVGEHDFRNLCKIDPTKQLTTFNRRIRSVDISPVEGEDGLYVFNLVGTAFLYNQVRHIMAVLFLVGTGMEHPSIVSALLNTDPDNPAPSVKEGEPAPPVVQSKPEYQMADPLPLMLWECGYDESDIDWRTDRNPERPPEPLSQKDITGNLYHQLQSLHERSVIHTTLDAHFLKAAARHHSPPPQYFPRNHPGSQPIPRRSVMSIPLGAGAFRRAAIYVPLLERARAPTAESMNERWRVGKGARRAEKKALENGGDE
ncbi:putative tRNA pseudouridine synthase C25B8.05 [Grifola frondosa]|uniref:tRNA pseudouridine synthase n=1 Tax=Grifola frondosa TaxID=5627 RepID=A0A1C7MCZ7_GRIFR|nr:putative tRNA pseudouridine synthase C25B8.05 [Grifola frondosa]